MAKQKKKRTKRYTGSEAAQGRTVHRYEAVERGRVGDWWVDHKTRIRIFGIIVLIIFILALIISGIFGLFR